MPEKRSKENGREDELNQSRYFTEQGINRIGTETPTEDGDSFEPEEYSTLQSMGREQPGDKGDPESKIASDSEFFGQGFGVPADTPDTKRNKEATQRPIDKDGPTSLANQPPTPGKERREPEGRH